MEALFHFVFELIKIAILVSVYATLILLTFKLIAKYRRGSWFDRVSRNKLKFWLINGIIIFIGLFVFMFTHYGDHGLGDSARIPIGHFREIKEINGTQSYIQDSKKGNYSLSIDSLYISEDFVYGLTGKHNENYYGKFFLYNLKNNEVKVFETTEDFENELTNYALAKNVKFQDFNYYYNQYWNGWRFWMLP